MDESMNGVLLFQLALVGNRNHPLRHCVLNKTGYKEPKSSEKVKKK